MVDVAAIRRRLLGFGWVKDARVSRRLPDTLVIDIVERRPSALWQSQGQLALIDDDGVVLDRVPVDKMPDLPLLIGPGANAQARRLSELMTAVPTLKPQLASASWVGGRRWDLNFQSGETLALARGRPGRAHRARQVRQPRQILGPARPRHRPVRLAGAGQDDRPPAARAGRTDRSRRPAAAPPQQG